VASLVSCVPKVDVSFCVDVSTCIPNHLKSTENYFVAHKLIDKIGNILDLSKFRDAAKWIKEKANEKGFFPDLLIYDIQGGKKVAYNIPAFKKLDGINAQAEKLTKRTGEQGKLFKSIDYKLRSLNILQSPKADEIFRKGDKNNWVTFFIKSIIQEIERKLLLLY